MSRRKESLAKNIAFVGYNDMNKKPGFQMAMHKTDDGRYYIYTGSFRHNGWNIIDVTNPEKPRNVKWMEGPWLDGMTDGAGTPKIQIADGIMVTAHGPLMKELHGIQGTEKAFAGVMLWDIRSDPENPKFLSQFECKGGAGVHRFCYNGGRYVYVTGNAEGFNGFILRILDIKDPTKPVEVGRWWADEQYIGNKIAKEAFRYGSNEALSAPFLHACIVKDDIVYMAYANKGFIMLDVKDKANPKMLNCLPLNPPFGGGAAGAPIHSVLPLGDRPYVVVTTEGERSRYFANDISEGHWKKLTTQPTNIIGIVEITDIKNPSLISVFPYPEVPEGYTHGKNFNIVDGVRIPFGPHNIFDAFNQSVYKKVDDRVYCCYFNAGLRIYDVSDPFVPKEIAYFMPPDPEDNWFDNEEKNLVPGAKVSITEDVLVDDRGYIYFDTFMGGLYIVRCTV
ncbi:MAG: hypothetical protein H6Q73_1182 [Firmicutes bacterium]|nr:hypothetical protein [Bacillota bacterium]